MTRPRRRHGDAMRNVVAPLMAVAVAAGLFWPYGLNGQMSRDEGIYVYAGQQLAQGVPPYVSVFDPKGPVSAIIAGAGAWLAQATGHTDYYVIRLAFFVFALLAVLAVYLLATRLFGSRLAGLTAALALAFVPAFAMDALPGPDAKTPGVFFVVCAMLLLVERRWLLAGLTASLAVLTWQPNAVYAVDAVLVAALLGGPRGRVRAVVRVVAGGLMPLLATVVGFAAVGALGDLVGAAVAYPLVGAGGATNNIGHNLLKIADVVAGQAGGLFFWTGWALLLGVAAIDAVTHRPVRTALARPLVCVVLLTGAAEFLFAATNFQGYPDTYPLLPYACLGFGGAVALGQRAPRPSARTSTAALVVAALVALTAVRWQQAHADPRAGLLVAQRSDACGLNRTAVPGSAVYAIGDPVPLVLAHRTNPDRYIYLGMDVDRWKVRHTRGGFRAWWESVRRADPSVIVFQSYAGAFAGRLQRLLRASGYHPRYLGEWRVFVNAEARDQARVDDVRLTREPTSVATSRHGGPSLPAFNCDGSRTAIGGPRD